MNKAFHAISLVAVALGSSLAQDQVPTDKLSAFCVPKTSKPPTIDGTLDPIEWREAVAVSGVAQQNPGGNLLIVRPTTFYLAWDTQNLYLGCRTWVMPGYKPRVGGREPGTATAFDDGLELHFKPMGTNVAESRADSSYKFFITALGTRGDTARQSVGQLFRNWAPKFRIATRLTPEGSAPMGGRWLEIETRMSTLDFELKGPHRAGDKWKMLLAFNHMPAWMQAAIPVNSPYFDPSGFADITLVDATPAVQVTMDELPGPKDGMAAVKFQISNPTARPVQVSVLAQYEEWKEKTTEDLLKREQTLTVEPGKTAEFKLNEKFPRDLGKGNGGIYYRVTQNGRELFRYYTFFRLGYEDKWVNYTPPAAAFPLIGSFNPARNNFRLSADSYYLDNPADAKSVSYTVTRNGDTQPVARGVLNKPAYFYFGELLQLPALQSGEYLVSATMTLNSGKTLGPVMNTFTKLDEANAFASWWNKNIGDTERVLKPFAPLRRDGQTVTLWGRDYCLNALGLPRQITSQGQTILATESRIVVTRDGKETFVPLGGHLSFTEEKPWRIGFQGSAEGAGLSFKASGTIEQDGLVKISLSYVPLKNIPLRVDALRLEFPIRAEVAEALLCIGPGGNFASLSHTLLPNKQGRLWSTLELGGKGSGMKIGSFYPDVWLGSEQHGFYWWADSDEGWVPDDSVPAHEAVRQGDAVVLRNHIIGKPFQVGQSRTFTFSYNATPFKPLVKGWRWALHSEDGTFSGPHKKRKDPSTGREVNGWNWINPPSTDPKEWSGLWASVKPGADAAVRKWQPFDPSKARNFSSGAPQVHTSLPLTGYGALSSDADVVNYFQPDWGPGLYNKTQQDYQLYLCDRAIREGGIRTFYWDICYVYKHSDLQAGFGYRLPDGQIQPTFHGFNLRQYMMRLSALLQDNGLTPGGNVVHATNSYPLIAFPWVDAALDGEWAEIRNDSARDWVDMYPPDRMRAMSVSDTWGTQISWMNLIKVTDRDLKARHIRGFLDWQRLHDSWTGPGVAYPPNPLLEWGLNDERVVFVPYWRNDSMRSGDKDVLLSQWRLPDRVILLAFNYADKATAPKDVTVKCDWTKLGLATSAPYEITAHALGANYDKGVRLNGDTLSIPKLEAHTARYIGIQVTDTLASEQMAQELTSVGLATHAVPEELLVWGIVSQQTKFLPFGTATDVQCADQEVQIAMWQLSDRVLLAVNNIGKVGKNAVIDLNLDKLGLTPHLPWQEFVRVRDFDVNGKSGSSSLDFYRRTLSVLKLQAGDVRLVGVRRY